MIKETVYFVAGVAAGIFFTKEYFKNKYETYANEEIESVKNLYSTKNAENGEDVKKKPNSQTKDNPKTGREAITKKNVMDYAAVVQKEGYIDYSNNELKEAVDSAAYVITPDEFATNEEYEVVSLTFYKDKILANDINGEIIEDVDNVVGLNSLEHFGEYEEDCVYVRNDRLRTDYEILLDERNYSEACNTEE